MAAVSSSTTTTATSTSTTTTLTSPTTSANTSEVKSKWKKLAFKGMAANSLVKAPKQIAAETKTSKMRAEWNAMKGRDGGEEWIRCRNMEKRREIESLKRFNDELKGQISQIKETLKEKEAKLQDIVKKERHTSDGKEYILLDEQVHKQKEDNYVKTKEKLKKLEQNCRDLQSLHEVLQNEKKELKEKLKVKIMESELDKSTISSLEAEKEIQRVNLEQAEVDLKKEKDEITNMCKMYEQRIKKNEEERWNIENKNKEMLNELKDKCNSVQTLDNELNNSAKRITEQEFEIDDLVKMVSDLEVEKGQLEDELKGLREDHTALTLKLRSSEDIIKKLDNQGELTTNKVEELTKEVANRNIAISGMKEDAVNYKQKIDSLQKETDEKISELKKASEQREEDQSHYKASMKKIQGRLNELQQGFTKFTSDMEKQIQEKIASLVNLKECEGKLSKDLTNFQNKVIQKNEQIVKLEDEMEKERKHFENFKEETRKCRENNEHVIKNLREELNTEKQVAKKLNNDINEKTREFTKLLETLKSGFEESLSIAEDRITSKRIQVEALEGDKERLTEETKNLKAQIEILSQEKNNLNKESKSLQTKYENELSNLKNQLELSNANSSDQEKIFKEKLSEEQKTVEDWKTKFYDLKEKVKSTEEQLNSEIEQLKQDVVQENKRKEDLNHQLDDCEDQNKILNSKLENLKVCNENLNIEVNKLKDESSKRQIDLVQKEKEYTITHKKLKKSIEELNSCLEEERQHGLSEIKKKEDEIERQKHLLQISHNEMEIQKSSLESMNEKLISASKEIMKLELEKKDLKKHCEDLTDNVRKETVIFQTRITNLEDSLQEYEDKYSKLEYDNSKLQNSLQALQEQINIMKGDLEFINQENQNLVNELGCSKERIKELENINKLLISEIENLKEQEEQQLVMFKRNYESQNRQHKETLSVQQHLTESVEYQLHHEKQKVLSKEKEIKEANRKYQEALLDFKQQDKALRDANETYMLEEINRIQRECRNKIIELEAEQEQNSYELQQSFEDKFAQLNIDLEESKHDEVEIVKEDYRQRLHAVIHQRDELMIALKKMETVLLDQKLDYVYESKELKDELKSKVKELDRLQVKYDAQNKVVDHMLTSLEQERSAQRGSKEILETLNKLERQFNEQFSCSKHTLSTPRDSVDSLLDESCTVSIFDGSCHEFNITWPQPVKNYQPDNRKKSTESMMEIPSRIKEKIEEIRAEITLRLKDIDNFQKPPSYRQSSPHRYDDLDYMDGMFLQSGESSLSPHQYNEETKRNQIRSLSKADSMNKITDSGFTETSYHSIYIQSQLRVINDIFSKLNRLCGVIKKEQYKMPERRWHHELETWKKQVHHRLQLLHDNVSETTLTSRTSNTDVEKHLPNVYTKSIVFRPSANEVKAIIDNVNRKYETTRLRR
ncbi:uncharacterized protein LOC130641922 isoform X2 [Hydractinia symbiolongicarpus]|nr:uncharacterized protein LOC130641922 isoform X2 [Hydractinia symbiolongicarpus]